MAEQVLNIVGLMEVLMEIGLQSPPLSSHPPALELKVSTKISRDSERSGQINRPDVKPDLDVHLH